jgi:hypothetical protein
MQVGSHRCGIGPMETNQIFKQVMRPNFGQQATGKLSTLGRQDLLNVRSLFTMCTEIILSY